MTFELVWSEPWLVGSCTVQRVTVETELGTQTQGEVQSVQGNMLRIGKGEVGLSQCWAFLSYSAKWASLLLHGCTL